MQHSEDTDGGDENRNVLSQIDVSEVISEEESNFIEQVIYQTSLIHIQKV